MRRPELRTIITMGIIIGGLLAIAFPLWEQAQNSSNSDEAPGITAHIPRIPCTTNSDVSQLGPDVVCLNGVAAHER